MLIALPLKRLGSRLRRDDRAVSAIEFALGAPVFLLLLLMGIDTARFVLATRQVEDVAATIGQMISVNQSGSVNYMDLQFFHDSAMVIFPQVLADSTQQGKSWSNDIGISMASIQFTTTPTSCTSNCTYTPKVLWTGGSVPRSCTVMPTSVTDTAAPSSTTLPSDVYGSGSVIVIDVTFNFRPTIAPQFMKPISIARSYYVSPRYVAAVSYAKVSGDNGIAKSC
jgi:Flp pilus assembly protein TadG